MTKEINLIIKKMFTWAVQRQLSVSQMNSKKPSYQWDFISMKTGPWTNGKRSCVLKMQIYPVLESWLHKGKKSGRWNDAPMPNDCGASLWGLYHHQGLLQLVRSRLSNILCLKYGLRWLWTNASLWIFCNVLKKSLYSGWTVQEDHDQSGPTRQEMTATLDINKCDIT